MVYKPLITIFKIIWKNFISIIRLIDWPILFGMALWRYDLFENYLMNPVLINLLAAGRGHEVIPS